MHLATLRIYDLHECVCVCVTHSLWCNTPLWCTQKAIHFVTMLYRRDFHWWFMHALYPNTWHEFVFFLFLVLFFNFAQSENVSYALIHYTTHTHTLYIYIYKHCWTNSINLRRKWIATQTGMKLNLIWCYLTIELLPFFFSRLLIAVLMLNVGIVIVFRFCWNNWNEE